MVEHTFKQEVLDSSAPVLVHFGAPWCGPCRMIEPLLARLQTELGSSFKLIGINADENLRLTSQYRITTLPTLLIFEGGRLRHRIEGLHKREVLWSELTSLFASPLQAN